MSEAARIPHARQATCPDPVDVVRRLGGRATVDDLYALSSRRRLRTAVTAGRLVRAAKGIYVLPELPDPEAAAARARGVLSHASAAHSWGLALVQAPDAVHVTVARGARPAAETGVHLHWSTLPPASRGPSVTPVLRTVLDCATTMPFREALAVADSALAFSFVTSQELVAAAARSQGPGRPARLRVARTADRRAENAFESCLRAVLLESGISGFRPQQPIRLGSRVIHADLGDPVRRVAVEADSFAHHGTRIALVRDCERYDEMVAAGWLVLRFAWEQVMFRPEWVADVLERALHQPDVVARSKAGARPAAGSAAVAHHSSDVAQQAR